MSEQMAFPAAIQKKILAMLLFDGKALGFFRGVVRPEFFDNPALRDLAIILYKFYDKYKRPITIEELEVEFGELISASRRIPEDEYRSVLDGVLGAGIEGGFEYVQDKVVAFAQYQAIKNAISDAADIVKRKKNYEEILSKVRDALAIGESDQDLGVFYHANLDARIEKRLSGLTRADCAIGTALRTLDRKLGGGLGRGELGIIMGPMKRGKTVFSVNMAYGAMSNGIKVAHYIMEGSEDRLQVLYDARISGLSKDLVAKKEHQEEVRSAVNLFHGRPGIERLIVKHFPAQSCSPLSIENHINRLAVYGFDPELIIVDYLGLMVSTHKAIAGSDDRYLMFGQITKELLSLAQRGGYAIWLLHQSTRGSRKKVTIDLEDSADSIEPMRDADLILTLNQTEEEQGKDSGDVSKIRIFVAGGREVADRTYVDLVMDKRLCRFEEIGG